LQSWGYQNRAESKCFGAHGNPDTLAEIIGASEQTLSLWERDRGQIQPAADRILRLFYAEHVAGNVQVRKFMEQRAEAGRERQPRARKLTLEKGRTWREAVAA
jgi:transcriptional regulator with XRE-family HTH domain